MTEEIPVNGVPMGTPMNEAPAATPVNPVPAAAPVNPVPAAAPANSAPAATPVDCCPKKSNTLGLLALIFSIIGIVLMITVVGIPLGIILLVLALILGLIGLCKAPRGKAVAGIIISLVSLLAIGYAVHWASSIVLTPIKEFVVWMEEEAKTDTELRLVFKQPGFERFLQSRFEARFTAIDVSTLPKTGDPKTLASFYTNLFFEEMKAEIPLAVDAWIAMYGLPNPDDDMIGVDPNFPNPDEWRMDDDLPDGEGMSSEDIEVLIESEGDDDNGLSSGELEQLLDSLEG